MANKHLKRESHKLSESWWWYEEPAGICIVHNDGSGYADAQVIKWRSIKAALSRKEKQ